MPLFRRAICMSGDASLRPIKTIAEAEADYLDLLTSLRLDSASSASRIQILKETPWQELVKLPKNMRPFPTHSTGFEGVALSKDDQKKQCNKLFSWCTDLMMGDCAHDVSRSPYAVTASPTI